MIKHVAYVAGFVSVLLTSGSVAAQAAYDAAYIGQTVPASLELYTPATVIVTMQNTGMATWVKSEGDVFLSTQEPQDNYFWCIQDNRYGSRSGNRVLLPYDVLPNAEVTFTFVVKPLSCGFTGTPPMRFRMLSQTHGTFGEETPDAKTTVTNAAEFVAQQVPAVVPAGGTVNVTVTFKNTTLDTWTTDAAYSLSPAVGNDATWKVGSVPLPAPVAPGEFVTFSFYITAPTVLGNYNFQWRMNNASGTPFGQVSPATSVSVVAAGSANYQGLWWNSPAESESGWGISLAHEGTVIFATWFTYDLTGRPSWLSMTAQQNTAGAFVGTLFRSSGPAFNAVPFNPSLVRSASVGSATLTFTDINNGTFAYTVNGVSQRKSITRQLFGTSPTCSFGIEDPSLAYNYQDLWWAVPGGSESGWGVSLTHQGDTIFATWYTYDLDGTPLWLSATAPKMADGTYAGALYRTTGPPFSAVPFDPANVVATSVGSVTFSFMDGNTGQFTYTVGNVLQSKTITRQIFQTPGTVCQ